MESALDPLDIDALERPNFAVFEPSFGDLALESFPRVDVLDDFVADRPNFDPFCVAPFLSPDFVAGSRDFDPFNADFDPFRVFPFLSPDFVVGSLDFDPFNADFDPFGVAPFLSPDFVTGGLDFDPFSVFPFPRPDFDDF